MVDLSGLKQDIHEEVSTILSSDFSIDVTGTASVPHSDDGAITFPNLDEKVQGTKLLQTAVLYVDMRRSTALSLRHRPETVAKLYSAFVRAITRCAGVYGGEVRGIIGDRVMMLFETVDCFANCIDTTVLINSVCQYILNKNFTHNEVTFGIGIDYGNMLATKTGVRRHGSAQQSYRSLVWLGRPANIASKLTDRASKPEETFDAIIVTVAYNRSTLLGGSNIVYLDEMPHEFVKKFRRDPASGLMIHSDPTFHSFTYKTERLVTQKAVPPILMTRVVYEGYRTQRPGAIELANGWYREVSLNIPEYQDKIFGGDVVFLAFKS
jgi:class 3 adenylate cyclase